MKKADVAALALISLLLGGCKTEEAAKPSIPEAEGSGRKLNVAARSGDKASTPTEDFATTQTTDSVVSTSSATQ